jgi:uncharacterized protein
MKIGIFGSTGFIGKNLSSFLALNHNVVCFTRKEFSIGTAELAEKIKELDVIINLVGAPILTKRWTKNYKKIIISSRLEAIAKIKEALSVSAGHPPLFISASAVGIYSPDIYNDEFDYKYQNDFLSDVVRIWETAVNSLGELVSKSVIIRLGIVLGSNGGALKHLVPIYKLGLGGVIGNKDSTYPYISLNDVIRAISFLIQHKDCQGVYNFVEPVRVSNKQIVKAIAGALNKSARFNIPAWSLKLAMGARAEVLMAGQYVFPKKLLNLGFEFQDSDIAIFLNKELNKA